MPTIITGSRSITDYKVLTDFIEEIGIDITEVFSYGKQGVNVLGKCWAAGHRIPFVKYNPQTKNLMIDRAEDLIFIYDKRTSKDILDAAIAGGLEIYTKQI